MATYEIEKFGATGDGYTSATSSIQKAIDTCWEKGGGQVVCGSGIFRTGSLVLKSNVELRLEPGSRLVGSEYLKDYQDLEAADFYAGKSPEKSRNALILAVEAENIALTGQGEINGSGMAFYDLKTADEHGKLAKPPTPRPRIIMFYRCRNVLIKDLTFRDASCWTIWLMRCENVHIHRLKIFSNRRMRNIDGIDIDACRQVTVSDCLMDTEDDCIAVRSIQQLYDSPAICEDVVITNCIFRTQCNGIRVGCPGDGEIRNCVFSNLIISDSTNGLLIQNPAYYLPPGSSGSADIHDLVFSDISITCRKHPLAITVDSGIKLKRLSDITFNNIKVVSSGGPILLQGSPETILRNIRLQDIEMKTSAEEFIICRCCESITLDNLRLQR